MSFLADKKSASAAVRRCAIDPISSERIVHSAGVELDKKISRCCERMRRKIRSIRASQLVSRMKGRNETKVGDESPEDDGSSEFATQVPRAVLIVVTCV